jgi:hypothetical protein
VKQAFLIRVDVPEGVSADEVASHRADAHRMAVRGYHESDPMHGMAEIDVCVLGADQLAQSEGLAA